MVDDELSWYYDYKFQSKHYPSPMNYLEYDCSVYRNNFEPYFNDYFFEILKRRVSESFIKGDNIVKNDLSEIETRFLNFYRSFNGAGIHETYVGAENPRKLMILLKKICVLNNFDPICVDSAAHSTAPGRALFFLELFVQMNYFEVIEKFRQTVFDMDESKQRRLISSPSLMLVPWDHQEEAFNEWNKTKNGIVEMATGTGKTVVGLMTIQKLSEELGPNQEGTVRILAHSTALLDQWRQEAVRKFNPLLDETKSYKNSLKFNNVTIHFNTIQKIVKDATKLEANVFNHDEISEDEEISKIYERAMESIKLDDLNSKYYSDLLIVDEVHHSAAPSYRKIFGIKAKQKLGLSATVDDNKGNFKLNILERELRPVVYNFDLKSAIDRGILPKFKWDFHTTYLDDTENAEFEKITKSILTKLTEINDESNVIIKKSKEVETEFRKRKYPLPKYHVNKTHFLDLKDFISFTTAAQSCKITLPPKWVELFALIFKRREIIHDSKPKLDEATKLAEMYLKSDKKIIMFLKRTEPCDEIAELLRVNFSNVFVVHSKIKDYKTNLEDFKAAKSGILIGANILNEGIDIPDAEIGINVSSSKTRLELIQRIGRVIRKKGNKVPHFHHYSAIPKLLDYYGFDENLLSYIEDLSLTEDIAWSQETALKLGIDLKINDTESNDIKRMEQYVANNVSLDEEFETSVGSLNILKILHPFYEQTNIKKPAYLALRKYLQEYDGIEISDSDWSTFIFKSFAPDHDYSEGNPMINIPGHYWILLLGGRNPENIVKIFNQYEKQFS